MSGVEIAAVGVAGGTLAVVSAAAGIASWRLVEQVNFVNRIASNTATTFDYQLFEASLKTDESLSQLVRLMLNAYESCGCLKFAATRARRLRVALTRVLVDGLPLPPEGPLLLAGDLPPPNKEGRMDQRDREYEIALLTDENFRKSRFGRALVRDIREAERIATEKYAKRQAEKQGAGRTEIEARPKVVAAAAAKPSSSKDLSSSRKGKTVQHVSPEARAEVDSELMDKWYATSVADPATRDISRLAIHGPSTSDARRPPSPSPAKDQAASSSSRSPSQSPGHVQMVPTVIQRTRGDSRASLTIPASSPTRGRLSAEAAVTPSRSPRSPLPSVIATAASTPRAGEQRTVRFSSPLHVRQAPGSPAPERGGLEGERQLRSVQSARDAPTQVDNAVERAAEALKRLQQ